MNSEDFAVVIGLSNYTSLPALSGPENDAQAFAAWLMEAGGGAIATERVGLLLTTDSSVSRSMLDELLARALTGPQSEGRIGRRLYIYASGHGASTPAGDLVLMLPDATPQFLSSINLSAYAEFFRLSGLYDEIVLFADCSRVIYQDQVLPAQPPPWTPIVGRKIASTALYGFSSQRGGNAYEATSQDAGAPQGHFTRALLQGLSGGAADAEGRVTSTSLMAFVTQRLKEQNDPTQTPEFHFIGSLPIVFATGTLNLEETQGSTGQHPSGTTPGTTAPNTQALGGSTTVATAAETNGSSPTSSTLQPDSAKTSLSSEPPAVSQSLPVDSARKVPDELLFTANPTPRISSDRWAERDSLGYEPLARTIATLITHEDTVAPLTIGIKAAWGAGKTSLMKRVQYQLDGDASVTEENESARRNRGVPVALTLRQLLAGLRELTQVEPSPSVAAPSAQHDASVPELPGAPVKQREAQRKDRKTEIESILQRLARAITDPGIFGFLKHADKKVRQAVTFIPPTPRPSVEGESRGIPARLTVWFNAWKYQTGEQIWAGLAHCIISQVTARMSAADRELFWLKLHAARVDVSKLRWQTRLSIVRDLVPWLLFCSVLLLGGIAMLASPVPWIGQLSMGVSGLFSVAGYLRQHVSKLGEKVSGGLRDLVREPNYEGKLGFLHLVESDIREILDLVATPKQPLVIFVDDLDRCSPSKVAEIVEAINLFLSGDYPNCIFVLGMEPAIVAAALEVANKDVLEKVESFARADDRVPLGWRFMEKIVQLPLAIPLPGLGGFKTYLADLTGGKSAQAQMAAPAVSTLPPPPTDAKVAEYLRRLSAAPSVDRVVQLTEQLLSSAPAADKAGIVEASKRVYARQFTDRDPVVSRFLSEMGSLLQYNPRQLKRYINTFRFTSTLRHNLRMDFASSEPAPLMSFPSDRVMAKYIALNIHWPQAMDYFRQAESLATSATGSETLLARLEACAKSLSGASSPQTVDNQWREKLKDMNVSRNAWIRSRAFRQFLAAGDTLGGHESCGLW